MKLINQHDENNLKHGLWIYKDADGNAWCEVEYQNGAFHGKYKEVLLINNKEWIEEGCYDNGKRIAHWKRTRKYKTREVIYIN